MLYLEFSSQFMCMSIPWAWDEFRWVKLLRDNYLTTQNAILCNQLPTAYYLHNLHCGDAATLSLNISLDTPELQIALGGG
jgi:hypothetical protein